MSRQLAYRSNIIRLLIVAVQCEPLRHLPYEYLPIVGARCDNSVVEGVPNRVSATFLVTASTPTSLCPTPAQYAL